MRFVGELKAKRETRTPGSARGSRVPAGGPPGGWHETNGSRRFREGSGEPPNPARGPRALPGGGTDPKDSFPSDGYRLSLTVHMTTPALARFFDKLEDGWQTGTLVKLTLSDYAGPEPGLRNGYGRVVELKDGT